MAESPSDTKAIDERVREILINLSTARATQVCFQLDAKRVDSAESQSRAKVASELYQEEFERAVDCLIAMIRSGGKATGD